MRGARPASIVLVLGLAAGLAACGDERAPSSARMKAHVMREALTSGAEQTVTLPTGTLRLTLGRPVASVPRDRTKDLKAMTAPDGGSIVPISWEYSLDEAPLGGLLATQPKTAEVSLRVEGREYPVGEPYSVSGTTLGTSPDIGYYVPVAAAATADDVQVEVAYDGLTQVVSARGPEDLGAAAALSDLPTTRPATVPCPSSRWTLRSSHGLTVDCTIDGAFVTPYFPGAGWAEGGQEWAVVQVAEVRLLTKQGGEPADTVSSIEDRSTLDGERATTGLSQEDAPRTYVASGTSVFPTQAGSRSPVTLDLSYSLTPETGAPYGVRATARLPIP